MRWGEKEKEDIDSIVIVISQAASTVCGVDLAKKNGISLVGFVRGKRTNIYTSPERIEV